MWFGRITNWPPSQPVWQPIQLVWSPSQLVWPPSLSKRLPRATPKPTSRPKVPHGTQRRHLRGLFVAREHSDKLSREQNAPFRSRDDLGRLFREQNAPSRSRDNLGRPFREQNTPFRSRDCRERHTRQPRRFFSELREPYGNSTGALRALLDAAEVRPEPVGLVIGLSAFRNRHLDG